MRIFLTLLLSLSVCHPFAAYGESADVCLSVFEQAEQEQASIAGHLSARGVAGAGRVYFHAAPDRRCQLKNVFVIPGDRLEAYAEFGEFTSVIYWNATADAGTAGWVLTSRLKEIDTAVAVR